MSALGHKRIFGPRNAMSGLPLKADIGERNQDVRFVPKADSCTAAIHIARRSRRVFIRPSRKDISSGDVNQRRSVNFRHCFEPSANNHVAECVAEPARGIVHPPRRTKPGDRRWSRPARRRRERSSMQQEVQLPVPTAQEMCQTGA
jgi:hypothetical protein